MQVKKQLLKLDMEQWSGSKLGGTERTFALRKLKEVFVLPPNPGFYNQSYTPGNSSDGLVLKAGSLLSTEVQEEKNPPWRGLQKAILM